MPAHRPSRLELFTRNRHLLILSIALILIAGLSALTSLPRIEDPRITTRNATIITPFPGATATRVEALVTKKIEDELRELSEIKTIESTSRSGISVINIELQDWVGPDDNQQVFSEVRDALADATAALPPGAATPTFDDNRGAVAFSMIYALSWRPDQQPAMGILTRTAEQLADLLRDVPGSEQVVLFGDATEELRVDVDAAEAAALGMGIGELAQLIKGADTRRSAGTLRGEGQDIPVEIGGAIDSVARIADVPLTGDARGGLTRVGDIAVVSKQWQDPPEQVARHGGARSILVAVRTEEQVRLDQWAEDARAATADFAATIDPGITLETAFDQSEYTQQRLGRLAGNLIAGAAVITLVVFFMMGWRPALIVGTALPLSAALSLFGLTFFGEQIHQMSIFGMIIAIGLLIDNAIVVTDRVVERRRAGDAPTAAVRHAIQHLFSPLFASTLTTILGFMPIFLLPGNVGDFVGPIAIAVVLALTASFVLSMTVIPALAGLLANADRAGKRHWWRDGVRNRRLGKTYRAMLEASMRHPWRAVALAAVLPLAGFVAASQLGMQFFPPADRDQIEIQVWMPSGTGIRQSVERIEDIEDAVMAHDGIEQQTWVAGASSPPVYYNQLRQQDNNPAYARGVVQVTDSARAKALERQLQADLTERFRDAQIVVKAFGQGPPIKAPVGFRIVGPDADQLRLIGESLRRLMHEQTAITHTQASILGGEPKLWLLPDEQQARLAGLTLNDIADQFEAALDGRIGGRVLEDIEDLPVRVRYAADSRGSVDAIATLRLNIPSSDAWVPASALGEISLQPALQAITRRNGERVNEIQGFLRQGVLPIDVTNAIMQRIDEGAVELPPGYRIQLAGDSAEQQRAVAQLLTYAPVLAALMIATLVLSFRSFALAGLIGAVAIGSVGLGMLSLWFAGFPLGFNPIIGSAGLVGVAINGSIVVLAAIRSDPRARAGDAAAIVVETVGATRHILSTTLTTMAGFLPLLLFTGGDFWPPLAVVIAGGVGMSGLLSLLLTPSAYLLMASYRRRRSAAPAARPA